MLIKRRPILSILLIFALFNTVSAKLKLQTGIWRGALQTSSGNKLPFNFEVKDTAGRRELAIINGDERFKVTDVKTTSDSVFIHMPLFNSEFRLKLEGDTLKGKWIKHLGEKDASIDFTAIPNTSWRFFKDPEKPAFDVSGRWSATFGEGESSEQLEDEFKQTGIKLTET